MVITEIITHNVEDKSEGICGEFSIVLDDSLCIHRIFVINGKKGLFIAFPHAYTKQEEKTSRKFVDIVHPTKNTLRQHIQTEVIKRYHEELEKINENN